MTPRSSLLRVVAGIAGPVAFTAAWAVSSARQEGYRSAQEHISGLAAVDARDPQLMTGGFLALGTTTAVFARALEQGLGGPRDAGAGPILMRAAGVGILAAGLLRRDRMLLSPPGEVVAGQSWRNDGHDLASGVVYATVIATPLALARRFRHDPEWRGLTVPALCTAGTAGGLLALFASRVVEPWNGIVQRAAVTVPAAAMAGLAARLLRRPTPRPQEPGTSLQDGTRRTSADRP